MSRKLHSLQSPRRSLQTLVLLMPPASGSKGGYRYTSGILRRTIALAESSGTRLSICCVEEDVPQVENQLFRMKNSLRTLATIHIQGFELKSEVAKKDRASLFSLFRNLLFGPPPSTEEKVLQELLARSIEFVRENNYDFILLPVLKLELESVQPYNEVGNESVA